VRAAMANLRPAMNFDAAKEIHCIGCDRHLNPFLRLETISCRMPTYIFGTLSQNYALEVLSNFYLFTILHEGLTSNSTSFFVYNIWCGIFIFNGFDFVRSFHVPVLPPLNCRMVGYVRLRSIGRLLSEAVRSVVMRLM
jgi:hypothetical protein